MPELPEVETTRRALEPYLQGKRIVGCEVYQPRLRYPIPANLPSLLRGRSVIALRRRSKYLILDLDNGSWLLVHLGMSGKIRLVDSLVERDRHDHVELVVDREQPTRLRLNDPRRFGCVISGTGDPLEHKLLARLGPEPFESGFDGAYLYRRARGRRIAIKAFLMDASVVVGVGNIYANEALYRAGIRPDRAAGKVAEKRYAKLAAAVREVLEDALAAGGTTLRDYTDSNGKLGYFVQQLAVYGGGSCPSCGGELRHVRLAQRSTWFCACCQR
ncbi:bifunctional DNA-formamidopyrimidine glycosylase/DNA-(apurinic or apyrimidinic site) lyase [Halorhodospira halochloris]|uniref:bifunctional DNA-formamidopyrimidine glycosylase/DNA-(apurinic or apyrimidinic site) lyase n=1 Tax=Halorhodospira halochloris TaxID=1052 RepID=UPI000BBB184C|nr:bifunctional DNA-formamidopyrimidine glycosylase/DNA-(apurinic or apyrimidinic site) lyase [Halorhodospira halochloris]MBK1650689.1 DNA-formamidopyrimidine glycosylase [Halorhodospira halochloris]MCG5529798.1 bifunctional DNA-formamidopyrimidine glycosylase/DNA-(apurinic or apyrimidinic site) lyase [Halorhodospira halochloris]MCG5548967.1 bifunctional DNA-formamidopyrimidine glycosylase/DNA-(apurinic or apyrimidinic site) lyase [Halorhodospira halochloris]